jgi:hypothetical protein
MWGLLLFIPRSWAAFVMQVSIVESLTDSCIECKKFSRWAMRHATCVWLSGNQEIHLLQRNISGWKWFNLHIGEFSSRTFFFFFLWTTFFPPIFEFSHAPFRLFFRLQIILISRRTQSWKAFMLWERSIFGAVDLWNSLFLYSLAINLRTDLIQFSPFSVCNFFLLLRERLKIASTKKRALNWIIPCP